MDTTEKTEIRIMFFLSLSAMIIFAAFAFIVKSFSIDLLGIFPPCIVLKHFGTICPGCGITRSVAALLEGRIPDSFMFHPLPVFGIALVLWSLICGIVFYANHQNLEGRMKSVFKFRMLYLYIILGVIVIQWILKLVF